METTPHEASCGVFRRETHTRCRNICRIEINERTQVNKVWQKNAIQLYRVEPVPLTSETPEAYKNCSTACNRLRVDR